jgi:hypothetical protein
MADPTDEELLQENKEAIASGVRRMQYDDHELEYHSTDQQLKARRFMKKEQESSSPRSPIQLINIRTTKGLQ